MLAEGASGSKCFCSGSWGDLKVSVGKLANRAVAGDPSSRVSYVVMAIVAAVGSLLCALAVSGICGCIGVSVSASLVTPLIVIGSVLSGVAAMMLVKLFRSCKLTKHAKEVKHGSMDNLNPEEAKEGEKSSAGSIAGIMV